MKEGGRVIVFVTRWGNEFTIGRFKLHDIMMMSHANSRNTKILFKNYVLNMVLIYIENEEAA